jgi:hypothetical protein|tara:strand:- start:877 stop:1044 length:168 start_codon:yes stop_codon:yes gene_type:complete
MNFADFCVELDKKSKGEAAKTKLEMNKQYVDYLYKESQLGRHPDPKEKAKKKAFK